MCSNVRSYSNPIYDYLEEFNQSFSQPLMIDIEPICSHSCSDPSQIPLLLLANCFPNLPVNTNQHNYVNQRINDEDDENLDPLYAKPRKRCVTLMDEPIIIPPKTSRISMVRNSLEKRMKINWENSLFFFFFRIVLNLNEPNW